MLTISITTMAHDKANAASRFSTPQKKVEVPEWFKIFEKKNPPQQVKFQVAGTSSSTSRFSSPAPAATAAPAPRPSGIGVSMPAISYRNVLLERPQISVGIAMPAAVKPGSSASMQLKETSKSITRSGGAGMLIASGSSLSGNVYKPFDQNAPSDYAPAVSSTDITERRNGFGPRPDTPPSPDSPIGEPWILLAFAAAFGGFIAWKKKKTTNTQYEK